MNDSPRLIPPNRLKTLATLALGALLLTWPALLNRYPILYSDTGGFLEQALMPDMGWDKPWIYGPFLTPFHWRQTLWPIPFIQSLIISALLWRTQAILHPPRPTHHLVLCGLLAIGTAAPWFTTLLMPDIFAPATVLGLFILAASPDRRTTFWVATVTTIAIAAHLAHLVLAAACIAALALLTRRLPLRPALPLVAALATLLLSNLIGNGVLAISPFGATFALARLVADGPARTVIQQACPAAGWHLCAWKDRLPQDSDVFLWDPYGPVWADAYGPIKIAPEAATIVATTLRTQPGPVLAAALANTARQLIRTRVGDALIPDYLDVTILPRLQAYFPQAESDRFTQSREAQGTLPQAATPLEPFRTAFLLLGTAATVLLAITARRTPLGTLAALTLVALLANAFATGALSGPHDRYQARIAWLVVLPPILWISLKRRPDPPPPSPATDGSSDG